MKTKITLLIAFVCLSTTSCIKDHIGHGPDGKEVQLTSENFLYDGALEKIYLNDQISSIEEELYKLDSDDPKRKGLIEQQAKSKQRIAQIIDLSSVGLDIPIICDNPNGKCIPIRLEFFVFLKIEQAAVLVSNDEGEKIGFSDQLVDLPGYEGTLQYIRIPVTDYDKQIFVEIGKIDEKGNVTRFDVGLNN